MAIEAARKEGWEASAEVSGVSPSGDSWRADVLATKANRRLAIEIQWSSQTDEETQRRQTRYAESAVEAVWLFRQNNFPTDPATPAVRIIGGLDEGFVARVSTDQDDPTVRMSEFFSAVFSDRLRFGLPVGAMTQLSMRSGALFCWSCGAETSIITGIDIKLGGRTFEHTVPGLGDWPDLFDAARSALDHESAFAYIKSRHSRMQGRSYLSNGCMHCDALVGEHFEHDAWAEESIVSVGTIRLTDEWKQMLLEAGHDESGWTIYAE